MNQLLGSFKALSFSTFFDHRNGMILMMPNDCGSYFWGWLNRLGPYHLSSSVERRVPEWYPSWIANLGVDWVLDGRFLEEFKGDTDMKICGYSTILQEIPQSGSVVSLTILMMSGSYPLLLDPERPWTGFIKARGYASNHESINSPKIGHPWVQK